MKLTVRGLPLKAAAVALSLFALATPAGADTILIVGDAPASGSATVFAEFDARTNTFTFTIQNTSAISFPGSDATITGIGYDLPPAGNASSSGLNGFTGSQAPTLSSTFTFRDTDLGPVPLFPTQVLDFGFLTGSTFATGTIADGLAPGESASFTVSGAAFAGFTEGEIANGVFARFESVAAPEPSILALLGIGALSVRIRRRFKGPRIG